MNDVLLLTHIVIATTSILVAIIGVLARGTLRRVSNSVFTPSVVLTVSSGAALVFSGGSITHACASGTVTLSVVYTMKYVSTRYFSSNSSRRAKRAKL